MQNFSSRQNGEENVFKKAANAFYGDKRKKEKEEKDLRNSLLYELRGKLTPAQKMYSDTAELMKLRDEIGDKNIQNSSNSSPAVFKKYNDMQNNRNSSTFDDRPMQKDNTKKKINNLKQVYNALGIFASNYNDMKEANTKLSDKYFHSKANCEASQQGKAGAKTAKILSDFRESTDIPKNKYLKKYPASVIITDYRDDGYANLYGRLQGLNNPDGDCKILVDKYRPNGLDERY